jgi:hypoxanthine phosphoribosyltransferase
MTRKTVDYTWQEFDQDMAAIQEALSEQRLLDKFDYIYGIPRGGLVIAVALSHRLNKPMVTEIPHPNTRMLIVDDISDSGATLAPYNILWPKLWVATIHYVKGSQIEPNVWIHEKPKGDWIHYPWEA